MKKDNFNSDFDHIIYKLLMERVITDAIEASVENLDDERQREIITAIKVIRESLDTFGNGHLNYEIKGNGYTVNLLKKFQASLKHIVYQAHAVSDGSFTQSMDFMGEISDAFNKMLNKINDSFESSELHRVKAVDSEKRHRLLADNATDVIWTMTLEGKFTYVSPSVEKLRGYTPEEVMNQKPEEVLCPNSLIYMQDGLTRVSKLIQEGKQTSIFRGELEQPCKDGTTVWTESTVSGIYDENGRFTELLGITRDITDRKKLEAEIIKISITDKLTQLYNRLKLESLLESAFNDAYTKGKSFHVAIFDIDFFKTVNDKYGHPTGDLILVELADLLKRILSKYGNISVGRWGGEEFLMILQDIEFSKAVKMVDEIRLAIALNDYSIPEGITCSFGVAQFRQPMNLTEVILAADQAMYAAKAKGRNCVESDGDDAFYKNLEEMIRI